MSTLIDYVKHVRTELQHVSWPSTRTAVAHTLVVITLSVLIGLMIGLLDYAFSGIVSRLIGA